MNRRENRTHGSQKSEEKGRQEKEVVACQERLRGTQSRPLKFLVTKQRNVSILARTCGFLLLYQHGRGLQASAQSADPAFQTIKFASTVVVASRGVLEVRAQPAIH